VVVSCQPHFNAFIPQALRRAGSRAKYAHVITDLLHVHAFHFAPDIDLLIVPNAEVKAEAVGSGIAPEKIFVGGYPIMPDFERQIKDLTGLDQNNTSNLARPGGVPQLLLMGGGEGMGQLRDLALALMRSDLKASLTVVCGRNTALQEELLAQTSRLPAGILGFTENIPELMAASDVLISKAGTGTVCEGLAAGLPIILYHAVPGQEDGNRAYLVAHKAAAWCPSIPKVMAQLEAWLGDGAERRRAGQAARALANPRAAVDIARRLALVVSG
jgi:1,2-diacylglycerol 3-beta-galactosyltransferase